MRRSIVQSIIAAASLLPNAARAEPIKLRLSFFMSATMKQPWRRSRD
jgi:hypothetical protein